VVLQGPAIAGWQLLLVWTMVRKTKGLSKERIRVCKKKRVWWFLKRVAQHANWTAEIMKYSPHILDTWRNASVQESIPLQDNACVFGY